MKEQLDLILSNAKADILGASNLKELNDVKVKYQGKNGEVTKLMQGMRDIPKEDRPAFGKLVNDLRTQIDELYDAREVELKEAELIKTFESEAIDITLPSKKREVGTLHPLTLVKNELIDAFTSMGFEIFEGPEIEEDYYNFQMLNIPEDHPARDMQDTFYINDNILLRTQTSAGQVRVMLDKKPPIKILSPGKVYRSDDDASHSPMFHQMEGLVVDKNITLCDLKGTLDEFCKIMFGKDAKTRLRPSYFPFTEPSVEVDVSCSECHGKGCKLCKGTGWIEILGAGIVNKKVLEGCGIDSEVYSGYAFGMGIERIAILKYKIPDIRLFFENDIRFLKQFK
ncbi:MAG: phenylalanine--tRNA ligase subunit alpha [Clostridiales bacterium]|nr:phenylalanine--tRNA ligase subunit alpha [Clostridiales bacterium]